MVFWVQLIILMPIKDIEKMKMIMNLDLDMNGRFFINFPLNQYIYVFF